MFGMHYNNILSLAQLFKFYLFIKNLFDRTRNTVHLFILFRKMFYSSKGFYLFMHYDPASINSLYVVYFYKCENHKILYFIS